MASLWALGALSPAVMSCNTTTNGWPRHCAGLCRYRCPLRQAIARTKAMSSASILRTCFLTARHPRASGAPLSGGIYRRVHVAARNWTRLRGRVADHPGRRRTATDLRVQAPPLNDARVAQLIRATVQFAPYLLAAHVRHQITACALVGVAVLVDAFVADAQDALKQQSPIELLGRQL